MADLLRILGPLDAEEVAARLEPEEAGSAAGHLDALVAGKRALRVSFGGQPRVAAIEDASRLRDALGVPLPIGTPLAFVEPVADPLGRGRASPCATPSGSSASTSWSTCIEPGAPPPAARASATHRSWIRPGVESDVARHPSRATEEIPR